MYTTHCFFAKETTTTKKKKNTAVRIAKSPSLIHYDFCYLPFYFTQTCLIGCPDNHALTDMKQQWDANDEYTTIQNHQSIVIHEHCCFMKIFFIPVINQNQARYHSLLLLQNTWFLHFASSAYFQFFFWRKIASSLHLINSYIHCKVHLNVCLQTNGSAISQVPNFIKAIFKFGW